VHVYFGDEAVGEMHMYASLIFDNDCKISMGTYLVNQESLEANLQKFAPQANKQEL